MKELPKKICPGEYGGGHVQGAAVDTERGFAYFSFTTELVKTDLAGNFIGSVTSLTGHLGCISLTDDGRVVGSLEYKSDSIGRGIAAEQGTEIPKENAFYLVIFDTPRIDRANISADGCDVMRAAYLSEPTRDYADRDEISGHEHRYGCSGIDATGIGPLFGCPSDSEKFVSVCYGIYGAPERCDNDYQVIQSYPLSIFDEYAAPLSQSRLHKSGPKAAFATHFLYTGNTEWGVQNLEYDSASGLWFFAVYSGRKPEFSNFDMFCVRGTDTPELLPLRGRGGECGRVIKTVGGDLCKSGLATGYRFPYGSTGIASVGDGFFYISKPKSRKGENGRTYYSTDTTLYRHTDDSRELFELV